MGIKPVGYEYIERVIAPSVVEFYVRNNQGHRVVRIYLDLHSPRFEAFNESSSKRSPAILFLQELLLLIERSRQIVDPNYVPIDESFTGDLTDEDR